MPYKSRPTLEGEFYLKQLKSRLGVYPAVPLRLDILPH